jgi:hypothetical protein
VTKKEMAKRLRCQSIFGLEKEEEAQLRGLCRWMGLSDKGEKRDLMKRLAVESWEHRYD